MTPYAVGTYLLGTTAVLGLVATASGPPVTAWRVAPYVALPVMVVVAARRGSLGWSLVPLAA